MSEKVLESWVAEGNVLGTVGTRLSEARIPIINRLSEVFGEAMMKEEPKAERPAEPGDQKPPEEGATDGEFTEKPE